MKHKVFWVMLFTCFWSLTPYIFLIADLERGYDATGGELIFPAIPLIIYAIAAFCKDAKKEMEREQEEIQKKIIEKKLEPIETYNGCCDDDNQGALGEKGECCLTPSTGIEWAIYRCLNCSRTVTCKPYKTDGTNCPICAGRLIRLPAQKEATYS